MFPSSTNREIRHFHVVVCRDGNVQKKRDDRGKLLFCQYKPVDFLSFSLTSPSLLLKLLNVFSLSFRKLTRPDFLFMSKEAN